MKGFYYRIAKLALMELWNEFSVKTEWLHTLDPIQPPEESDPLLLRILHNHSFHVGHDRTLSSSILMGDTYFGIQAQSTVSSAELS